MFCWNLVCGIAASAFVPINVLLLMFVMILFSVVYGFGLGGYDIICWR